MISRTTLMSTSTPAPIASICSGQTEIDASSAGAAAVARTPSVTSGGCSAAAALADTPAVAAKFNDVLSVVCSSASSLVDGASRPLGPPEREGDVETLATGSLAAASARVSELSCGVDVEDSSRFGDSATLGRCGVRLRDAIIARRFGTAGPRGQSDEKHREHGKHTRYPFWHRPPQCSINSGA